jgi:ABC-type lipoprotein export system ATPase subunit
MPPDSPSPFSLELRDVTCLREGAPVLRELSLGFAPTTFNVLVGDAGCEALLRIASLLDPPASGDVKVGGLSTFDLDDQARAELRSRLFGYLFAAAYLLPSMTVVENVAMPLFKIAGASLDEARGRTEEVLAFVGLANAGQINVGDLTWSEKQRVALARGLVHRPAFIIVEHADSGLTADESAALVDSLREVPARFGAAVIAVLSASFVSGKNDRVVAVHDGAVRSDSLTASSTETSSS